MNSNAKKLPVVFLSHGGGPCFFMDAREVPFVAGFDKNSDVADWYRKLAKTLDLAGDKKPKAMVVISAHWEASSSVRITARQDYPELFFDYYGFPEHTYQIKYPAPGSPALAQQIQSLLSKAGIDSELDVKRNYDHGVFVPLKLVYPDADVPIVQVSLLSHLDAATHIKIGKALESLRSENVLIVGSGFATHDMSRRLTPGGAKEFTEALTKALANSNAADREKALADWKKLPSAKAAHPREEHLIPLHVVAGAAGEDKASVIFDKLIGPWAFTSYRFG